MSKKRHREATRTAVAASPVRPRSQAPAPAWRGRIGLIVGFFAITIGLSYAFLYGMFDRKVREFDGRSRAEYPHDSAAFTQGIVCRDGRLYESTGQLGKSSLRRIDLASGQMELHALDDKLFGEGVALVGDRLLQLTYRNGVAIEYDLDLKPTGRAFEYEGEGWGLTSDGRRYIMSNGSSTLQFRDLQTFEVIGQLDVYDGGRRVAYLNELESVDGRLYANVWHKDYLLEIDPASGQVVSRIYLAHLFPPSQRATPEAVLNGIAYNAASKRLIVTGKFWPKLFEIELVPRKR